ncbi:hypothetical protein VTO73DRAFT_5626 [Trametes versicolor]
MFPSLVISLSNATSIVCGLRYSIYRSPSPSLVCGVASHPPKCLPQAPCSPAPTVLSICSKNLANVVGRS